LVTKMEVEKNRISQLPYTDPEYARCAMQTVCTCTHQRQRVLEAVSLGSRLLDRRGSMTVFGGFQKPVKVSRKK
jgi:hypothetical protein